VNCQSTAVFSILLGWLKSWLDEEAGAAYALAASLSPTVRAMCGRLRARTPSGHVIAAPPRSVRNARLFIRFPAGQERLAQDTELAGNNQRVCQLFRDQLPLA
jgi:hypothetical protein